jgi:peptide/nickel transport system ATP-binding protein
MTEIIEPLEKLEPLPDIGGVAQPLLQVDGLTKHFPVRGGLFAKAKTVRAVDNVSFAIAKGETRSASSANPAAASRPPRGC